MHTSMFIFGSTCHLQHCTIAMSERHNNVSVDVPQVEPKKSYEYVVMTDHDNTPDLLHN